MSRGERDALQRDFNHCFADVELIDANGLTMWALNTQAWFNWHWARFEKAAQAAVKGKYFHTYYSNYSPSFLEWSAFELRPIWLADDLRGYMKGKDYESRAEYDAGKAIFFYFRNKFAEENRLTNPHEPVK